MGNRILPNFANLRDSSSIFKSVKFTHTNIQKMTTLWIGSFEILIPYHFHGLGGTEYGWGGKKLEQQRTSATNDRATSRGFWRLTQNQNGQIVQKVGQAAEVWGKESAWAKTPSIQTGHTSEGNGRLTLLHQAIVGKMPGGIKASVPCIRSYDGGGIDRLPTKRTTFVSYIV